MIATLKLLLIPPLVLTVLLFVQSIVIGGAMWSYNDSLLGLASTAAIYWVFVLVLHSLSPHAAITVMLTVAWIAFELFLAYTTEGNTSTIMGTNVVHTVRLSVELAKVAGSVAGLWRVIAAGHAQQKAVID